MELFGHPLKIPDGETAYKVLFVTPYLEWPFDERRLIWERANLYNDLIL
jgi:hypothetical protein